MEVFNKKGGYVKWHIHDERTLLALQEQDLDGNKVVKEVIFGPGEKTYRYCKHISKQRLPNLSSDLMKKGKHFISIRSPLNVLVSVTFFV
ncbi:branched-chain-amino-acid aminotransferase-like protein 2 [Panicum virgatum]|uniref:branched-chain-amino-acid aminotransferase-like protein 2 n=1 Tax=Panicum virgatum TaxID=38727 RepID=UPI0019D5EAFA|nr:branched-chain-amino-acid aminotransferase-like protein 2 [Panicum virgatum]